HHREKRPSGNGYYGRGDRRGQARRDPAGHRDAQRDPGDKTKPGRAAIAEAGGNKAAGDPAGYPAEPLRHGDDASGLGEIDTVAAHEEERQPGAYGHGVHAAEDAQDIEERNAGQAEHLAE